MSRKKCGFKKYFEFVVVETPGNVYLELRKQKDGILIASVCCPECVDEVEKALKKFKRTVNETRRRKDPD